MVEIKPKECWPIVYRKEYNVTFFGLENLHPFDSKKWAHIYKILKNTLGLNQSNIYVPDEITEDELLTIHSGKYLKSLKWSYVAARISEIPVIVLFPNFLVQRQYLRPLRFQVGGTRLAGKIARKEGVAINLGGGFHHCSKDRGGGFCPYADISLVVNDALQENDYKLVMIIDLDAHQGNGYERDFIGNSKVFIIDVFNKNIYPKDTYAETAISKAVKLDYFVQDYEYLTTVESALIESLIKVKPDFIIYNAGTDILKGDKLGLLSITPEGIIQRDEMVFKLAQQNNIPLVMLTSGGYRKSTANIIAASLQNLVQQGLVKPSQVE
ncbi:histone deacetylase 11 isoform X2 [Rhopalosiphum padi]|uniref:histone deacetylase 11 isoform X2 n=1 Tax=Rhopalosiphum padi TaxID=40932 RepID=UPI00298D70EE|nr:histone deacetylase 11 isoform X2 [Rhopalosiphum padi]